MVTLNPTMVPIQSFRNTARRCGIVLLLAVLLSTAAAGQSLTPEALHDISGQLAGKITDTTRVRLLLDVSAHASAHVDRRTALDSALQFAKDALTLSTRIRYDSGIFRAYLREIAVWVNVRDRQLGQKQDASKALDNKRAAQAQLIAFLQKNGSPDQLGEAYMDVAKLYEFLWTDHAEALLSYDSAAVCFKRSGNTLRESHALYHIGYLYCQTGKQKESIPIFHHSIALAEPIGGSHLYNVYGILGNTYRVLGGYTIALKYELKALQLAEAAGDTTDMAGGLHLFLGLTYDALKNFAAARAHYEKAYRIDRHYTDISPNDFVNIALNLARDIAITNPQESIDFLTRFKEEYKALIVPRHVTTMTTRFMQAYMKARNYAAGQPYCDELIASAETRPDQAAILYSAIGQFLVYSKQYHAAEKYLIEAERMSKEKGRIPALPNIYLHLFKVDSAKGDYLAAIEKFKLHKAYTDSVMNDVKAKEVALLEIEYETAEKEQAITLLTKDSELGHQRLAQSRLQKNAILAGLAVVVLILGLLFRQYQTKKKTNMELTHRQQKIQTTNALLQKTILEKEWLLKEVHHRVKNNLQTVVSLLGSQSYALQNTEAASAIHDSQNRVHAMSLIHQKLYLTEHRTSINMAGYLGELTEYLRDSFPTGRKIQFQLSIQPIELDVSQAIPVGLILNEAITNAIKYAFPAEPKENCLVVVSMQQDINRNVRLTIADNGRGLPPDFDSGKHFGMGMRLMHGLTSEIDGYCNIGPNNNTGVAIEITFSASALLESLPVAVSPFT